MLARQPHLCKAACAQAGALHCGAPTLTLRGSLRFSESRGRYGSIGAMGAERARAPIAPSLVRCADRPSIPAMLSAAEARRRPHPQPCSQQSSSSLRKCHPGLEEPAPDLIRGDPQSRSNNAGAKPRALRPGRASETLSSAVLAARARSAHRHHTHRGCSSAESEANVDTVVLVKSNALRNRTACLCARPHTQSPPAFASTPPRSTFWACRPPGGGW